MRDKPQRPLEVRVREAAEICLVEQGYASVVNILTRIGYLASSHLDEWCKGRFACLQEFFFVSPGKIESAISHFEEWARQRNLQASEVDYLAPSREPSRHLQFTRDGNPETERIFRTRYLSPDLPEKKREKLRDKMNKAPELVVFEIYKASKCSECDREMEKSSLLFMEMEKPLCLECADMDHLVYLPRGDATVTRRARKNSTLSAVVVRFSRARGGYERQATLVEEEALQKAEAECISDADARARQRQRAAVRRIDTDEAYTTQFSTRILDLFPRCPPEEARTIAKHAAERGSGRVGRAAGARRLEVPCIRLAVIASIRHRHTPYDKILMQTADRAEARAQVRDQINAILRAWGPGET